MDPICDRQTQTDKPGLTVNLPQTGKQFEHVDEM